MANAFLHSQIIQQARDILGEAAYQRYHEVCFLRGTSWKEDYETLIQYPEWAEAMMLVRLMAGDATTKE